MAKYKISQEVANAIEHLNKRYPNHRIMTLTASQSYLDWFGDSADKEKLKILGSTFKSDEELDELLNILVNKNYEIEKELTKREKLHTILYEFYDYYPPVEVLNKIEDLYSDQKKMGCNQKCKI